MSGTRPSGCRSSTAAPARASSRTISVSPSCDARYSAEKPPTTQLRALVLRCSHASVFAATQPMESLSRLTGLTSLRMGPNPEDVSQHTSPLGFGRLPSFISALSGLQRLDIAMADAPAPASVSSLDFTPLRAIPDVRLTLRADTSCRAVAALAWIMLRPLLLC